MKHIIITFLFGIFIFTGTTFSQGCADAGSDEGVQVMGFIQPQWDYKLLDKPENTFKFNRARLGVVGNIPYDFSYYFVLETSPAKNSHPYLLDAFVTYSRFPWAKVSVGQFKSPFSQELNTPCHALYTVNRSKVVSELASPDRDLGLMILGGGDTSFVRYAVGLMNGTGRGILNEDLDKVVFDNNAGKDIVARLTFQPLSLFSEDYYDLIRIGGSFKYGTSPALAEGVKEEDTKLILGGELQIKFSDFLFQSEYIIGDFVGSYTTGGGCGEDLVVHQGSVKKSGFYAQAMYMTPWNLQPVIKFESFDPDIEKDRAGADASVGTEDEYTFSQAAHGYQNTITFGVNYFFNDWTRLQINYLYQAEEKEFMNDMIMIQIQAKF